MTMKIIREKKEGEALVGLHLKSKGGFYIDLPNNQVLDILALINSLEEKAMDKSKKFSRGDFVNDVIAKSLYEFAEWAISESTKHAKPSHLTAILKKESENTANLVVKMTTDWNDGDLVPEDFENELGLYNEDEVI